MLAVTGIQFQDADLDGEFDVGELPLPGVRVYVDYNNNGLRDSGEPFDISDVSGAYSIDNIAPGQQWIRRDWPQGYEPTGSAPGVDRLIGVRDVAESASPTGEVLAFRDIDPQTGAFLGELKSEISITNPVSASTDGQFIYIVDNSLDLMMQVTPQGGLVFTETLPANEDGTIPYIPGPIVLGNQVYVLSSNNTISDWDPQTGTFTRSRTIQIAPEITSLPDGLPIISGAITESLDGETILLFSFVDDRVFEFDPKNATVTDVSSVPVTAGADWAAAAVAGELFHRNQISQGQLNVYDQGFNFLRSIGNPAVPSLVAGTFVEHGILVDTTGNLTIDQGYRRISGSISGVVSNDMDGNGAIDGEDQGVTGVTVFLDLNGNDWPDPGEPSDVTGNDGGYLIDNVLPGEYRVRAIAPRHFRASDSYPRQDRLFAVNHTSPTEFLRLYELDPNDGSILETNLPDIPKSLSVGLEYDGRRLILVHHAEQMIYEMATDGTILDSRRLGQQLQTGGFLNETDFGPVTIQGVTFHVRKFADSLALVQYVAETDSFETMLPITWDWGLESIPQGSQPSLPTFNRFAAGASADGTKIILATEDGRDVAIDPRTGIATFAAEPITDARVDTANAGFGAKHYKAFSGQPVEIYNESGTLLETWPHVETFAGLGGAAHAVDGVNVVLGVADALLNVNHHLQSTLSSLSGTVFDDANANGSRETGEAAQPNVDVYLDLNRNRMFDLGEPVTPTDSLGHYQFENLPEGDYTVRQIPIDVKIARASNQDERRVFGLLVEPGTGEVSIREIDPVTGRSLRTLPSPTPLTSGAGLALEDGRLYVSLGSQLFILSAETGDRVRTITIPSASITGIAILGNSAYLQDSETNEILVFDLLRQEISRRMDLGLINNGVAGSIDLASGLGEAADGLNLAVQQSNRVLIVDPATGMIVDEQVIFANAGLAGTGGELFVARTSNLRAYDKLGLLRRLLSGSRYAGLGAADSPATSYRVTVLKEDSWVDLDFANASETGVVSGTQFADANGNSVKDPGETGIEGVTVFADLNANNWPDPGEPQTVSAADGSYSLNAPEGTHLIRTLPPSGYRTSDILATRDRLFAVGRWEKAGNPPTEFIRLSEFDPTGAEHISQIDTDVPYGGGVSIAYDGRRLILTDNGRDTLSVVATDGTLIAETSLPGSEGAFASTPGPVVIDGTVYLYTTGGGLPVQLIRFDPDSMEYFGAMPISRLVDQDPVWGAFTLPAISSISESANGRSIIATSLQDARVFDIDPLTARMSEVRSVDRALNASMATGLGGEWLVRGPNTSFQLDAYDENFNLLRSTPSPASASGLAGNAFVDSGTLVSVHPATPFTLDSGQTSTSTSISGVVSRDANLNGESDSGEALAGVTVFLDANRDGRFDEGEVSTVTQTDGSYEFDGLLPADYHVSIVVNGEPATTLEESTALYALEVDGSNATIRKHDAITGEILREFPAPGAASPDAGLAVGVAGVYYASADTFWVLDPDDGEVKGVLGLPAGSYTGVASIGDYAYVLENNGNTISQIDPTIIQVIATIDVNEINSSSHDLLGSLGETEDGARLLARANDDNLVIHPDTGIIERTVAGTSPFGLAGADGEVFLARNSTTSLRVANLDDLFVRHAPVDYLPWGVGASVAAANAYAIRAVPQTDFQDRDFLIHPRPSISGVVYNDNDYDQARGSGEAGIAGVTVYLDNNSNGELDPGEPQRVTSEDDPGTMGQDESGWYEFAGLVPGDYSVRQVNLVDHVATTPASQEIELSGSDLPNNDFGQTELTLIDVDYGDPSSRSIVDSVAIAFNEPVEIDAGAFQIQNLSEPDKTVQVIVQLDNSGTGTIATLSFSGDSVDPFGSIIDGNYRLIVQASQIRDSQGIMIDGDADGVLGGNFVDEFFRLFGDTDGDRDVDGQDYGRFGLTFLKSEGQAGFNALLDHDDDGDVDGQDYGQFGLNFLSSL